ncbi:hypothetical protein PWT90_04003 [Aphanocladium album]|nr:hypothetical protein PWT90_04003 [Aphanocladium album]
MGFLTFLQRRQGDKPSLFASQSSIALSHPRAGNTSTTVTKLRKRNDADLLKRQNVSTQQLADQDNETNETIQDDQSHSEETWGTPTITVMPSPSIAEPQQTWQSESRPFTAPFGTMGLAYNNPGEAIPFSNSVKRRLSNSSSYSDLLSRRSSAVSSNMVSVANRHVDLLDAHGQLGPSDFKARIKASGSREYGEDVAERNIGQNGLLLGSPAVQKFYATRSSQVVPRRQNTSQTRFRKYANKEVILEHPEIEDAYPRPSSRASSVLTARSMPMPRSRATPLFDNPSLLEPQHTGRASIASSHATMSSIGQLKLEANKVRSELDAGESDDAFPPSIPRYRRNERESSLERPSSTLGSVRRARQSMDAMSAYNVTGSIKEEWDEELFKGDAAYQRNLSHHQRLSRVIQQQNLSIENMLRWRQSFGEVDEDQRSALTERAADSRNSRRQWSITSTEPTEQSDVSSVNIRPLSRATANTSVDIPLVMDPDEKNSCGTRRSYDVERSRQEEEDDACSITTDGSNIDAFMEKRKRRAAQEDEALAFNESGFFSGGGALPGLFDLFQVLPAPIAEEPAKEELASLADSKKNGAQSPREQTQTTPRPISIAIPPVAETKSRISSPLSPELNALVELTEIGSVQERELERKLQMEIEVGGGDTHPEDDDRCSSVATPESVSGSFVPKMYLTQRQRLLALGFDYDTDDDELAALDSDVEDDSQTLKQRGAPSLSPARLSIVIESPPDHNANEAARRRREAKKLTRVGQRARLRRVENSFDDADGNLADVE